MSTIDISTAALTAADWLVRQMIQHGAQVPASVVSDFKTALARHLAEQLSAGEVNLVHKDEAPCVWLVRCAREFKIEAPKGLLPNYTLMRVRPLEIWASSGYQAPAARLL
jgi:hypothetical protein